MCGNHLAHVATFGTAFAVYLVSSLTIESTPPYTEAIGMIANGIDWAVIAEEIDTSGGVTVSCDDCGDARLVEPDGEFVCSCGVTHQSPLLKHGLI